MSSPPWREVASGTSGLTPPGRGRHSTETKWSTTTARRCDAARCPRPCRSMPRESASTSPVTIASCSPDVRLGLTVQGVDLSRGAELLRVAHRDIVEEWTARSGKARGVHVLDHAEATLRLRSATGLEWQVRIRVAEAGVAVRYALDELQGLSTLEADGTRIPLPPGSRCWVLDYQTWYETPRRRRRPRRPARTGTTASRSSPGSATATTTCSSPSRTSTAGSAEPTR